MTEKNEKTAETKPVEGTQPQETTPTQAAVPNHDATDVNAALQRTTQDGKGEGDVPESDFKSFATENVEQEPEVNRQAVKKAVSEVLSGNWGHNKDEALAAVEEKLGLPKSALNDEINRRLQGGAPSALV